MMHEKRLKIAMLIKNFVTTGGAERYAVELSTRLARRGHDVHVYAQHWDPALIEGLTIHRVLRIRRPRYLNALLYAFQARRMVKGQSYDVIHSHQRTIFHHVLSMHHPCYRAGQDNSRPGGKFFMKVKRLTNPRHVVYRWLESRQFGCRMLTHVAVVSKSIKHDVLSQYTLSPTMLHVIYPGVNEETMSPERARQSRQKIRGRHGLDDNDVVIVFVGSEFKRKGLQYALEAISMLCRDETLPVRPHLLVLGSGDQTDYRRLAKKLAISDQVHFIGMSPHVEQYYGAADLCLQPSLSEPFGMAVLEAMACGLPVIVSKQQGVAELLQDGYNADLLDNPKDSDYIKECLAKLYDPSRRVKIGQRARETACIMTWDKMTDAVLALYEEIVQQRERVNA